MIYLFSSNIIILRKKFLNKSVDPATSTLAIGKALVQAKKMAASIKENRLIDGLIFAIEISRRGYTWTSVSSSITDTKDDDWRTTAKMVRIDFGENFVLIVVIFCVFQGNVHNTQLQLCSQCTTLLINSIRLATISLLSFSRWCWDCSIGKTIQSIGYGWERFVDSRRAYANSWARQQPIAPTIHPRLRYE